MGLSLCSHRLCTAVPGDQGPAACLEFAENCRGARNDCYVAGGRNKLGRSRKSNEKRFPGEHEPRDPNADERHHRNDRVGSGDRTERSEQRDFLGTVKASAESLLYLLNDVLDFSKIEAGKLQLEVMPFNLEDVVVDAVNAMAVRAHQKGLELIFDTPVTTPLWLRGDSGRLRQVLTNLIGNAIKFTNSGEVIVRAIREDDDGKRVKLHFMVEDTGIGIAEEKQRVHLRSLRAGRCIHDPQVRGHRPWAGNLHGDFVG